MLDCLKLLRSWTSGGQRRYDVSSFTAKSAGTRATILYACVSSPKQREDLQRQCEYLKSQYPGAELIAEVGGGLNYKRKKMLALLERVMSGNVQCIVVAYKDRLFRFGFDLFAWICAKHSCEIVVLNKVKLSPERELVEDILAILHSFSARLYGFRKYKSEISQDSTLPRPDSPSNLENMAGSE
ncbi:IS607 family transposase [Aerosakkonema funiforme]|uniref:IS607 family transposase n=1 Tax=Aerosakkonema funiforme TaxID=1246630 RepID=UPI003898DD64